MLQEIYVKLQICGGRSDRPKFPRIRTGIPLPQDDSGRDTPMSKEIIEFRHSARECIFCHALTASVKVRKTDFSITKREDGRVVSFCRLYPLFLVALVARTIRTIAQLISARSVLPLLGRLTPST